ncbi:MAG: ROK family protein, partial [Microbacterium sp.]
FDVGSTAEVVELARSGEPEAAYALRRAGQVLGRAIAYSVSLLNPDRILVGGSLADAGDALLSGIRESVYRLSLPLATRDLSFSLAGGDVTCGAVGVARILTDTALAPAAFHRLAQPFLTGDATGPTGHTRRKSHPHSLH